MRKRKLLCSQKKKKISISKRKQNLINFWNACQRKLINNSKVRGRAGKQRTRSKNAAVQPMKNCSIKETKTKRTNWNKKKKRKKCERVEINLYSVLRLIWWKQHRKPQDTDVLFVRRSRDIAEKLNQFKHAHTPRCIYCVYQHVTRFQLLYFINFS